MSSRSIGGDEVNADSLEDAMADLVGGMLDFVSTFDVRPKRVRRGEVLDNLDKKLRLLACQYRPAFRTRRNS